MAFETELREALAAADAAGRYVLAEYATFVPIPNAPASISTHVDRESQEIILRHLHAAFPLDGLVAEEKTPTAATALADAPRTWIVDPIDGTRGFAMKNDEFSVMIGLAIDGVPVVGVVVEPVRARVTYAVAGGGCFVRVGDAAPTRCRVTDVSAPEQSTVVLSHAKPGKPPKPFVVALNPAKIVETYSAGIKLAMVARGEVDIYVNEYANFHDWDVCAGHILVEEAGGRVTELSGRDVRYGTAGANQRKGMLASNGRVHDEVLRRMP